MEIKTKEELIIYLSSRLGISITEATEKLENLSNAMQRIMTVSTPSLDDIANQINKLQEPKKYEVNTSCNPASRKYNNKKFR